jgi:hypothetical protein
MRLPLAHVENAPKTNRGSKFDIAIQGNTVEEVQSNLSEAACLFFETADALEIGRRRRQ